MPENKEKPSLFIKIRYIFLVVIAIALMVSDVRFKALRELRSYVETALYPVLIVINTPRLVSKEVTTQFKSRAQLIEENERLSSENFMQRADLLRLESLEIENAAMRKLLNSPLRKTSRKIFAEVIDIDTDPYLKRIVINRGTSSGVYVGMPVITDQGLVGQVIETNYAYSKILLLVDANSSIPVINVRNHIRAIASGTGSVDELVLSNVPRSVDFQEGDLLISSGLGGVYPEGYPVAIVTNIEYSDKNLYDGIRAKPIVNTDQIKYVLLFFYESKNDDPSSLEIPPKEPTDSKYVLRQQRIGKLIKSMTPHNDDEIKDQN